MKSSEPTQSGNGESTRPTAPGKASPKASSTASGASPADPSSVAAPRAPRAVAAAGSWTLVGVIAASSAALGWFSGHAHGELDARAGAPGGQGELVVVEASFDAGAAARPGGVPGGAIPGAALGAIRGPVPDAAPASPELVGRLKADLLTLRALYRRLAAVAELDGGEFDVDFESDATTSDGEPLSALDPAKPAALGVLIARTDPMLARSAHMESIFTDRRREYDARVSGKPLADAAISSGFGYRVDPLTGRRVAHRGLDFTGHVGDPVHALADGVVTYAGLNGSYGQLVEIEHTDGYRTRYAHNDSVLVPLGKYVKKGEAVATLGNSGRSTGPHLHLEVRRDGAATDPRFFVR